MTRDSSPSLDLLLAQSDWVTALARALVRDPNQADDVVQATWLEVLQQPPRRLRNPRGFLATLLRRKVQRSHRSATRRSRHEAAAPSPTATAAPSAAELTARLETHRALVDAVLALDEPYRATVVLRCFEHLEVDAIAARMASPVATVRSRLQRGLQQLRDRLDRGPGGRDRWLPAVLGLAARPLPGDAAAQATGLGGGGVTLGIAALTMQKLLLVTAVALGLGVWFFWSTTPADERQRADGGAPAGAASRGDPGPAPATAPETSAALALQRSPSEVPASPPPADPLPSRRLVDRANQPLAGVAMRAASPFAVRWQGGDRGWISGPAGSARIEPAVEARLRTDAAFAAAWFAARPHADEWRAEVLGVPLPAREVTTDAAGGFTFAAELGATDATIEVGDPRFVLLARGRSGVAPWRAGPATRVAGVVHDADGVPLPAAFALPLCAEVDDQALPDQLESRSDDAGEFLVRRALAGGLLRVRCVGYRTAFVRLGDAAEQRLDVTLQRGAPHERRELSGLVIDVGGVPIADARVWFGRSQLRTDAEGRFEFAADGAEPQYALTIVKAGYTPLQRVDMGAQTAAPAAATRDLLFVLERSERRQAGLVLGSDGQPLAGALVGLLDPTLLDVTFNPVEGHAGGFDRDVTTDAEGRFQLPGLLDRSYRWVAIDPRTGARVVSEPQRPDAAQLVLRLPDDDRRQVPGRVRRDGVAMAGARVELAFCTHVTKGGGTMLVSAPAVECAPDGRFVLPLLPRRGAWLLVRDGTAVVHSVPVEALPPDGAIEVDVAAERWLQLVAGAAPDGVAMAIHFEREDGSVFAAMHHGTAARLAANGDAPPLRLPAGVVAVVLGHGTPGVRRWVLTDDRLVHLRVR